MRLHTALKALTLCSALLLNRGNMAAAQQKQQKLPPQGSLAIGGIGWEGTVTCNPPGSPTSFSQVSYALTGVPNGDKIIGLASTTGNPIRITIVPDPNNSQQILVSSPEQQIVARLPEGTSVPINVGDVQNLITQHASATATSAADACTLKNAGFFNSTRPGQQPPSPQPFGIKQ